MYKLLKNLVLMGVTLIAMNPVEAKIILLNCGGQEIKLDSKRESFLLVDLGKKYQYQRLQRLRELGKVRRDLASAEKEGGFLDREGNASLTGEDRGVIDAGRKGAEIVRDYTEERIRIEQRAQNREINASQYLEKIYQGKAIFKPNQVSFEYPIGLSKTTKWAYNIDRKTLSYTLEIVDKMVGSESKTEVIVDKCGTTKKSPTAGNLI